MAKSLGAKGSPGEYVRGIETRHNQSAESRSVGAHARLPSEHPLHGAPDLIHSPCPPTGHIDGTPGEHPGAGGRMKSLPKSNEGPDR